MLGKVTTTLTSLEIPRLANPYPRTTATAAGLTAHVWTIEEIVKLVN